MAAILGAIIASVFVFCIFQIIDDDASEDDND